MDQNEGTVLASAIDEVENEVDSEVEELRTEGRTDADFEEPISDNARKIKDGARRRIEAGESKEDVLDSLRNDFDYLQRQLAGKDFFGDGS